VGEFGELEFFAGVAGRTMTTNCARCRRALPEPRKKQPRTNPRRYCSQACIQAAYRDRIREALTVPHPRVPPVLDAPIEPVRHGHHSFVPNGADRLPKP
jgi:hypothetical protein